jgi:hypothetical protein
MTANHGGSEGAMATKPSGMVAMGAEPQANVCSFEGFVDSPGCKSRKKFTCVHGRTLKWAAARRAHGLDPLLVYLCKAGHVQHLRNDAGKRTICDKCHEEALRLTPHEARKAKIKLTFNVRKFYHLSE